MPEFIDPVLGMKTLVFAKICPKRSFSIQSVPIDAGFSLFWMRSVPEFIDPVLGVKMIVFANISPKRSFSIQSVPIDAGLGLFWTRSVPEFIDPRFRENKPKTLVFSHRKRALWACFRENRVYNFRHRLGGSFQIRSCVEREISWFLPSRPPPPHAPFLVADKFYSVQVLPNVVFAKNI